ncbi:MAG: aldo/keto reductase [Lentisphaeria bacterium]|nr:aldo/keto reductase [Lentisphaeria bacterium]
MKYRRLGRTNINVSVVGIGTWQFGGDWGKHFEQEEVNEILDCAEEQGINLLDTAECYGDHLSEEFIGKYMAERKREDWIIATKFGHNPGRPDLSAEENWQPEQVALQFQKSLDSLQTDYVDLLQFHSGNNDMFDIPGLWELLQGYVAEGKVRHLGISISGAADVNHQTDSATRVQADAIQVVYNRLARGPEEVTLPSCQKQDLGVLARVPLASGYLSGKYKPGSNWPEGDVRHHRAQNDIDEALATVEKIRQEEVPEGVDMASWALAWCLRHPAVTTVIPGCKSVEQVISNAKAVELVED